MGDNLRDYFARIGDDDLALHGLETMAVCAATFMAAQHAGRNGPRADVHALLQRWVAHACHERPADEYRPCEPLLGELLPEIEQGRLHTLPGDAAALLFSTAALLKILPATGYYDEIRARIEPHQQALGDYITAHLPLPGLPALHERWILLCPLDVTLSHQREINKVAGIPIEFRGHVLTVPSRVKMIGSMPDHAMLVVEEGACCIEGYMQGVVVSRGDCIVQENIGGTVVSREGDIRARKVIDRATVIAKWGSVHCLEAAAPDLIFAGRRIAIKGHATRGAYRGHDISIGGRALGCIITVSGRAKAARFVHSDRFETAIVLRQALDATDYGEEIGIEARRLLARAARLKQRHRAVQELSRALSGEVEQEGHTVLLFLAGGDAVMGSVEELERAQRRLTALNRVIMGLHQLNSEVEENPFDTPWEAGSEAATVSLDDDLAAIIEELYALDPDRSEGKFTLEPEVNQLKQFRTQMQQMQSNRIFVVSLVAEWRSRLKHWLAEREQLRARIQQVHRDMEGALKVFGQKQESAAPLSSVVRLRDVLADESLLARDRDLQMRANSQFVRLMRRNLNARLDRIRELRLETHRLRVQFESIQDELRATIRVRATWDDEQPPPASVTGRFDAGVRLCTNALALETENAPDTILITLAHPREEVTSFVRHDTGILEVE